MILCCPTHFYLEQLLLRLELETDQEETNCEVIDDDNDD